MRSNVIRRRRGSASSGWFSGPSPTPASPSLRPHAAFGVVVSETFLGEVAYPDGGNYLVRIPHGRGASAVCAEEGDASHEDAVAVISAEVEPDACAAADGHCRACDLDQAVQRASADVRAADEEVRRIRLAG